MEARVWWLVGLAGCAWIGSDTHRTGLVDAFGLEVLPAEVAPCGGAVALGLDHAAEDGLVVQYELAGVSGQAPLTMAGAGTVTFDLPAEVVAAACPAEPCTLPLRVALSPLGVALEAAGTVEIVGPPGPPEVALADGTPLAGDLRVLEHPTLTTDADGVVATACDPQGACFDAPFVDGVLSTEALDVCPVAPDDGWTLAFSAPWDRCPSIQLASDPIPVRFLGDDCDDDGRPLADDCDDLDPSEPVAGWLDGDGDGYGSDETYAGCTGDPLLVFDHSDCDDARDDVYPGAPDVTCDGVAQDCVGGDGSGGVWTHGPDEDQDGFGRDELPYTQIGCAVPPTDMGGDCDDHLSWVNPGAMEDYSDLVDDDCDGRVGYRAFSEDLDAVQLVLAGLSVGAQQDAIVGVGAPDVTLATFGEGVATALAAGDVTGDGFPDVLYPSSDGRRVLIQAGVPWDGVTSPAVATSSRFTEDVLNDTVGAFALGDLDGDGMNDLVVLSASDTLRVYRGPLPSVGDWVPARTVPVPGVDRVLVGDLRGACGDDVLVWGETDAYRIRWETGPLVAESVELGGATDIAITPSSQLVVLRDGRLDFWSNIDDAAFVVHAVGGNTLAVSEGLDIGIASSAGTFVLPQIGSAASPVWGTPVVLSVDEAAGIDLGDLDLDGALDAAAVYKSGAPARVHLGVLGSAPQVVALGTGVVGHSVVIAPGTAPKALFVAARATGSSSTEVDLLTGTERLIPIATDTPPVLLGVTDRPTFSPACAP